jgi:hypothetical protein
VDGCAERSSWAGCCVRSGSHRRDVQRAWHARLLAADRAVEVQHVGQPCHAPHLAVGLACGTRRRDQPLRPCCRPANTCAARTHPCAARRDRRSGRNRPNQCAQSCPRGLAQHGLSTTASDSMPAVRLDTRATSPIRRASATRSGSTLGGHIDQARRRQLPFDLSTGREPVEHRHKDIRDDHVRRESSRVSYEGRSVCHRPQYIVLSADETS